jgi:hypothetical protein
MKPSPPLRNGRRVGVGLALVIGLLLRVVVRAAALDRLAGDLLSALPAALLRDAPPIRAITASPAAAEPVVGAVLPGPQPRSGIRPLRRRRPGGRRHAPARRPGRRCR